MINFDEILCKKKKKSACSSKDLHACIRHICCALQCNKHCTTADKCHKPSKRALYLTECECVHDF